MMTYVGSDTLAELVWSPQTGLNIKFAENKPCFLLEVCPSDMEVLLSQDTQIEKHATDEGVKSSSCPGPQDHGAADPLSLRKFEDAPTSGADGSGSNTRPTLGIEDINQCEPQENVGMHNVNNEKDGCFTDRFCKNGQVAILENRTRAEDKEQLFDCQENEEEEEAESHGSLESCKNVNLLTKRKRFNFEQQLILGSKRIKKQANEYAVKKDSSFMNWISNMLKGLKNHKGYDQRITLFNENHSPESEGFGFQNETTLIENKSVISLKETVLPRKYIHGSLDCLEIKAKETESLTKQIRLYEKVTKEAPKEMFDTIRRLRLSRTDILKWMDSQLSVAHLDGFFLRLRVAKWKKGEGGSSYCVACIIGLQGENTWKGLKQTIRVKVGDVECFVESRYISNCDFLEDELVAWWQKTSKNGETRSVKDLKSKLAERRTLERGMDGGNEETRVEEAIWDSQTIAVSRRLSRMETNSRLLSPSIDYLLALRRNEKRRKKLRNRLQLQLRFAICEFVLSSTRDLECCCVPDCLCWDCWDLGDCISAFASSVLHDLACCCELCWPRIFGCFCLLPVVICDALMLQDAGNTGVILSLLIAIC